MAEQKKQEATNGEFKTAPLGFDKNEVMAYIVQINKSKKALQEEVDELKRALEAKEAEVPDTSALEEIEKKKAELDAQILESRKQVLDERRKLAQTEKQLHVLQDQHVALAEEYKEFRTKAAKKIEKAKKSGGGTISQQQLDEISAKANSDANEVIADANNKAQEIINAAKAYYEETVKKAQEYKQTLLTKGDEYSAGVSNGGNGAIAATVDVFELLSAVAQEINDAVNSAIDSASEKAKAVSETAEPADEKKLSDDEAVTAARTALEASAEGALGEYVPMTVAPYDFKLNIEIPEGTEVDDDDDDDLIIPDENGLLSSFAVVSSADMADDMSANSSDDGFAEEDIVVSTPATNAFDDISDLMVGGTPAVAPAPAKPAKPEVKADDDISDLFTSAPAPAPAAPIAPAKPAEPEAKADDDISDLFTSAPAPAPAAPVAPAKPAEPEVKADDDISDLFTSAPAPAPVAPAAPAQPEVPEVKADDDISDLFTSAPAPAPEAPKYKRAHSREGYGSNGEKLNESGRMGVAGKEELPNDPWKDLEAQMNGMTITAPPVAASNDDLDDGMTSSYDDAPVEQVEKADDKIDMSDYSSMLGVNDNMNTSAAQFDPTWEFKMMEGSEDDDDEMSSDNVGFFDL